MESRFTQIMPLGEHSMSTHTKTVAAESVGCTAVGEGERRVSKTNNSITLRVCNANATHNRGAMHSGLSIDNVLSLQLCAHVSACVCGPRKGQTDSV